MSSRIANVRLDADRQRKARALRERGITLSDVVREAIDLRYGEVERDQAHVDVRAVVKGIFTDHPDPPGLPERGYDPHDRRAGRQAIVRKLVASKRR